MKKPHFLLTLFCLASLSGCLSDDEMIVAEQPQPPMDVSLTIPQSEAVKQSLDALKSIRNITRSASETEVGEVYAWRTCDIYGPEQTTRATSTSVLPDTLLYIVNFKNEQGFALVSADKRVEGIVALIDEGSLSPSDSIDNPGFKLFLENLRDYFTDEITSEDENPLAEDESNQIVYGDWNITVNYAPVLTTKWSQDSPFNNYCYTTSGAQAIAGCVAIATAQIIAFHQHPNSYNGHTYNWSKILDGVYSPSTTVGQNSVAWLVSDIGGLVSMNYGVSSSGANSGNVVYCWNAMGFHSSGYSSYVFEHCMPDFIAGRPIYMRGRRGSSGHAWVIDGAAIRTRSVTEYDENNNMLSSDIEIQKLIHCNWGWGGAYNGYFLNTVYEPTNKILTDNMQPWEGYSNNYAYGELKAYYSIYPN